jgi:hypothetical protein
MQKIKRNEHRISPLVPILLFYTASMHTDRSAYAATLDRERNQAQPDRTGCSPL